MDCAGAGRRFPRGRGRPAGRRSGGGRAAALGAPRTCRASRAPCDDGRSPSHTSGRCDRRRRLGRSRPPRSTARHTDGRHRAARSYETMPHTNWATAQRRRSSRHGRGALLNPPHLAAVKDKTVFTGGISRFDGRDRPPRGSAAGSSDRNVVLLGSRGGSTVSASAIADAMASSGSAWRLLGATPDDAWSADPWDDLTTAGVVVGWAGQNSIADIAAAGASAVIVPQEQAFRRAARDRACRRPSRARRRRDDMAAGRCLAGADRARGPPAAGLVSLGGARRGRARRRRDRCDRQEPSVIVSGAGDAVAMPVAVVSLCSTPRAPHLRNQLAALAGHADVERIVVWIDDDDPPVTGRRPHPAGRPRTGGPASRRSPQRGCGGGDRERRRAARLPRRRLRAGGRPARIATVRRRCAHPDAVLAGPVTYLPPGSDASIDRALQRATAPHAARPNPPDRTTQMAAADEYPLFWSLSFAVARGDVAAHRRIR